MKFSDKNVFFAEIDQELEKMVREVNTIGKVDKVVKCSQSGWFCATYREVSHVIDTDVYVL